MCGIAGYLSASSGQSAGPELLRCLERGLHHRGPDDQGSFTTAENRIGLVATRLAILDLSPAGHQPMRSGDGRYTIAFNGEIYNFRELRGELEATGATFRSGSDTEVILQLYERLGAACVERLRGMFAFGIWDEQEGTCFLARDPLGIKPLYYYYEERSGLLAFASEIKPLLASGLVPKNLDPHGLYGYFRSGSVPEPETLIAGVRCLEAGSWMLWTAGRVSRKKFWNLRFAPAESEDSAVASEEDAVSTVRKALLDSVAHHFVSDVPVALFLSGGIDSTALLALARIGGRKNLRTFSIGFTDSPLDESAIARRSAEHFGAQHAEWRLDRATGRALFDEFLPRIDQPTIDGFNTYAVSRFVHRQGLKVALSGLGGDELFGGYPSFAQLPRMVTWGRRLGALGPGRAVAGRLLAAGASRPSWRRLGDFLRRPPTLANAYASYRGIYTACEARALVSRYTDPAGCLDAELEEPAEIYPSVEDEISALELQLYMRNQLLRDSDVMSMANGLELRVPFVDRCLVEILAGIPANVRLRAGKQLLVSAVPEIPDWVVGQPKRGFLFPFDTWLAADWTGGVEQTAAAVGVRPHSWYQRWSLYIFESWWRQIK